MGLKEFVLDRERRMGRKEGREESNFIFTKNLTTLTDLSDEKIASIVEVEIKYVKKMRNSL
jgi:hypothetical protein